MLLKDPCVEKPREVAHADHNHTELFNSGKTKMDKFGEFSFGEFSNQEFVLKHFDGEEIQGCQYLLVWLLLRFSPSCFFLRGRVFPQNITRLLCGRGCMVSVFSPFLFFSSPSWFLVVCGRFRCGVSLLVIFARLALLGRVDSSGCAVLGRASNLCFFGSLVLARMLFQERSSKRPRLAKASPFSLSLFQLYLPIQKESQREVAPEEEGSSVAQRGSCLQFIFLFQKHIILGEQIVFAEEDVQVR